LWVRLPPVPPNLMKTHQVTENNITYLLVEDADGNKFWYLNGERHRVDGPAIEYFNGKKEWYYRGELLNCSSQEEFEKLLRLKAFW
jgi:hypothetical protein